MANMLELIKNNFFNRKPTRAFPAGPEREPFERSRGRIVFDDTNCIMCSICARKCPADAITVNRATGKWELNAFRCIICGECANSCPKKCITMTNERRHSADKPATELHQMEPPKPAAPKPAAPKPAAAPKAQVSGEAKA